MFLHFSGWFKSSHLWCSGNVDPKGLPRGSHPGSSTPTMEPSQRPPEYLPVPVKMTFRSLSSPGWDQFDILDWFVGENLNRKPMGFYHQIDRAFRIKFSHHPILWVWHVEMEFNSTFWGEILFHEHLAIPHREFDMAHVYFDNSQMIKISKNHDSP